MLWATPAALVALAAALLVACLWWWARSGRERLLAALPGVWMGGAGRPDQLLFVTRDLRGWLQLPGASGRCVFELSAGWGSGWSGEYTLAARGADGGAELAALPVSLGWPGPVLRAGPAPGDEFEYDSVASREALRADAALQDAPPDSAPLAGAAGN